jgi:hypothetical protein
VVRAVVVVVALVRQQLDLPAGSGLCVPEGLLLQQRGEPRRRWAYRTATASMKAVGRQS